MEKIEYLELFGTTPTANLATQLVNRLDSAMDELVGTTPRPKRVTGIIAREKAPSTGYLILRKNGVTVVTLDRRVLSALTGLLPLDIELAAADNLTVWIVDQDGSVVDLSVVLQYVPL